MTHWSENSLPLKTTRFDIKNISALESITYSAPDVYLMWLPFPRSHENAISSKSVFEKISLYCEKLHENSVICALTTPPDAALLAPYLERSSKFQLWVALRTALDAYPVDSVALPRRHAALIVFTKYNRPLQHVKTRTAYTYCPTCGKTTKDYGGKKHTYHEYGTLISDVWRDIECDPKQNINELAKRLEDFFGLSPHKNIRLLDMRNCDELLPQQTAKRSSAPTNIDKSASMVESKLLNVDCLKALRLQPENSFDFCFADPPYNLNKNYDRWNDTLESVKYFEWCDEWISELFRVLKPGRTLALLNIPHWAIRHYQYLSSIMEFQSWIAWDALSFPVRMIMPAHYSILCFSKGKPRPLPGLVKQDGETEEKEFLNLLGDFYCLRASCISLRRRLDKTVFVLLGDLWSDIHRLKHNSRRVDHPCQLPPMLMKRLFALFTNQGESILDCFNGAGTSTLVAQQMHRKYVGMEFSENYHGIAQNRHELLNSGLDPFGKTESIPTAKNSRVQRLPKQKYQISKKSLQLDVKRIALELGHLPSREEVQKLSRFPMSCYNEYFVSWGEVCAAARTTGMSETPPQKKSCRSTNQLSLFSLDE